MIMKPKFLLMILLCWPLVSMGDVDKSAITSDIDKAQTIPEATEAAQDAFDGLSTNDQTKKDAAQATLDEAIQKANKEPECDPTDAAATPPQNKDDRTDEEKKKALEEKEKAYKEAKETEQSLANRTLTAATTAATGIGGMELAMGLAQQAADAYADESMAAYLATMRCTYGRTHQVKAGPEEIELPGGNNQNMMNLRAEYFALAADLKERKAALGMQPGIESEEILDKAATGLYDDENIGITSGAYASLYRAQMLGSEEDQKKIDEERKASKNRVIGGAVAAGVGVVGGIVGNSLINGKLGEKLKEAINSKKVGKETQALLKKEADALKDLRACLKSAGIQETDKLSFSKFYPSVLSVKGISCKEILNSGYEPNTLKASDMFSDSTDETEILNHMLTYIDIKTVAKLVGYYSFSSSANLSGEMTNIKNKIKTSIESVEKKFEEAEEKDKQSAEKAGISIGDITSNGEGLSSHSLFSNITSLDSEHSFLSQWMTK